MINQQLFINVSFGGGWHFWIRQLVMQKWSLTLIMNHTAISVKKFGILLSDPVAESYSETKTLLCLTMEITVDNRYLRIHLKPCGKWFNWPCKKTSCSECPDIKRPLFSVIWDKADFSFTDKLSGWKERLSRQSQLNVFGFTTQAQINQEKPENLKAKSYFSTHWRMHSEGLTPEASC